METILIFVVLVIAVVLAMWLAMWLTMWLTVWWTLRKKGPSVGPFRFVRAVSERKDATMKYDLIKIKVGLPASTSGDVASRELTIRRAETADGVLKAEEVIETSMMELEFEAVQDSLVDLSCVAIDDADNRSEPAEFTFTVEDTVSPDKPTGGFTIEAIGERTVGEDDEPAETPAETPPHTPPLAEGEDAGDEPGPDEPGAAEADADEGEPTGEPTAESETTPDGDEDGAAEDTPPTAGSDVTNS